MRTKLERLLSMQEVADLLHVKLSTAWRMRDRGEFATVRVGQKRVLVEPAEIRRYLAERREQVSNDDGPDATGPTVRTSAELDGGDGAG